MEYIFTNKPEFVEPIRVLFLCGANINNNNKDKRHVLKDYLERDLSNKVIILEEYFEFGNKRRKEGFQSYYEIDLFNLFSIENLAALTATNVIIIHESISTAGELGVFGSNPSLRDRIITLIPEKYTIEEEKLSSFLKLAFWHKKDSVLPQKVIRYYPQTEKVIISDNRTIYYTYFVDNTISPYIGEKINKAIDHRKISSVCLSYKNRYLKYPSNIKHTQQCTYVNFEYDVFKNYMIALLTIPEFRKKLSECTKVFEIVKLFRETFGVVLRNTVKERTNFCSSKLVISINRQPELKIDDAISFMIYLMHACGLINIKNEEDNLISVHHRKDTSTLIEKYSCLVKKFKAMDWGK